MKKIATMIMGTVICFSLIIPSASAGSKQRHRWEGVAIGLGAAALLGGAILPPPIPFPLPVPIPEVNVTVRGDRYNGYDHNRYDQNHHGRHYQDNDYRRERGHWEVRKVWVQPRYEKIWNPGHYNHRNEWVPGRWVRVEREPGYWTTERIWVSSRW